MIKPASSRRSFLVFNYAFLTLFSISMLVPFLHILSGSFSGNRALLEGRVSLWPVDFTLSNYAVVFTDPSIWRSFGTTVLITVLGTGINLAMTCLMAYGLSKSDLKGRSFILLLVLFTMIFQAPLIPTYLLVKSLGLLNSIWALVLPGAISAFNMIIMISFFRNIPDGLLDSAKIDGCGEYRTLLQIVVPLSKPSLLTIGLFYAVGHWNSYFAAMMYVRNPALHPLQVKLRQLIVESDVESMMQNTVASMQSVEGIKMASIMFATLPILVIYPWIQKHFVKGSMLGSVKG
ncbi:carbohydrate ABC transporter permease [Paenibacillus sp. HJGM_3]|uniref:carbohydrate ABC transporter permease n=1 Tax=Paenibacillus sp. HJGM_3 TaxID=3379816 RepID=UPI0038591E0E